MLGILPTSLTVNGREYAIRTDFRDILRIISAYNDPELSDQEKVAVCLNNIFIDLDAMPGQDYVEAYAAATAFISANESGKEKASKPVINWEKDESILFPAVNKVAGAEVRTLPYLHWWTFMGYFQGIDRESIFGSVLVIRQKRAKGKKLEKNEEEFYKANRDICDVTTRRNGSDDAQSELRKMYQDLLQKGG